MRVDEGLIVRNVFVIGFWAAIVATPNLVFAEDVSDEESSEMEIQDDLEVEDDDLEAEDEADGEAATQHAGKTSKEDDLLDEYLYEPPRDYTREMLAILALLILWLLTRKHYRVQEARRPKRAAPVTPEELGRIVFQLVRSSDVNAYRALYLNGGEARDIFGPVGVQTYLEDRDRRKLEAAFTGLANNIPVGAQYQSSQIQEEICILTVVGSDDAEIQIPVGRVALVGAVIRLVNPPEITN